jgi:tetratricopeptide (TPR) repeat protein
MKTGSLESLLKHIQPLIQAENWQTAYDELAAADRKYPDKPAVLTALGECLIRLQKPEDAIPVFQRVIELEPDSIEAHNNLAVAHMFTGDFSNAEETYLEALQFKPDHLQTLKNLAFLYYQQNERMGDAATILASILRRDPSDCDALYLMGLCYQAGGQRDSAVVCFEKILIQQPDSEIAVNALNSLKSKSI